MEILHQLKTVVYPIICRVSTIRLVMQDFATIHSIIGIHRMYNHMFAQQSRDLGVNEDRMTVYVEIHGNIMGIYPTNMTHI